MSKCAITEGRSLSLSDELWCARQTRLPQASQFHPRCAEFHTLVEFQVRAAVQFVRTYQIAYHALVEAMSLYYHLNHGKELKVWRL